MIVLALAIIGGIALFVGLLCFLVSLTELFERVSDLEEDYRILERKVTYLMYEDNKEKESTDVDDKM